MRSAPRRPGSATNRPGLRHRPVRPFRAADGRRTGRDKFVTRPGVDRDQRDVGPNDEGEHTVATVSDESTGAGLQIDPALRDFVADELLPGLHL